MSDMTTAVRKALGLYKPRAKKFDLESFFPRVKAMAYRLSKTVPVPLDDLIGYGYLGLMDAAKRHDPAKGNFITYLGHRVMGAMLDGVREWGWFSRKQKDIRMGYAEDSDGAHDPVFDPTTQLHQGLDLGLLVERADLRERDREMMGLYLQGSTQREIAREYGLTQSRMSQIMKEIVVHLRRAA